MRHALRVSVVNVVLTVAILRAEKLVFRTVR